MVSARVERASETPGDARPRSRSCEVMRVVTPTLWYKFASERGDKKSTAPGPPLGRWCEEYVPMATPLNVSERAKVQCSIRDEECLGGAGPHGSGLHRGSWGVGTKARRARTICFIGTHAIAVYLRGRTSPVASVRPPPRIPTHMVGGVGVSSAGRGGLSRSNCPGTTPTTYL